MQNYDIVIIGGGLVGAGFASALRGTNLRVALVDARLPSNDDPRLFALNAGSCDFLTNIGIWPAISAYAAPINQVHVSSRGHFGAARLKSEDAGLSSLGYVIPAHYIESALNNQMMDESAHDIYRPAVLKSLRQGQHEVSIELETSEGVINLCAGLLVGADGAESAVRSLAGIGVDVVDYQQSAIVTRTLLARSHANIAYERFMQGGTIAMLPLCGNECATIWTGKNELIQSLLSASEDDFLQNLQREFGYRLGRLQGIAKRYTFPLRMMRARTMTKGNIFLLGNAAHTLHPIAAQGFNLAMYEAAVLIDSIVKAVAEEKKISIEDLQKVNAEIQQQQDISIRVSHQLADRFSGQKSLVSKFLPLGLLGFDLAAPVRRQFVKKIMGRSGRVPRLLMDAST